MPFLGVGIFGWLPMLAAVAMTMSSVTMVENSILLGRYKSRFEAEIKKRGDLYPRRFKECIFITTNLKVVMAISHTIG